MSFNYANILDKTPCFALIKNLTFIENNPENGIESGDIVTLSTELSPLLAELSTENADSTTEIYFFGGSDENKLFYFLKTFLNFLYMEDLINESTLVVYAQDTYF
jgi:hypothetical protein